MTGQDRQDGNGRKYGKDKNQTRKQQARQPDQKRHHR